MLALAWRLHRFGTPSHHGRSQMNHRLRHRERVRNAYLNLFMLLVVLPALMPLPLLFLQ